MADRKLLCEVVSPERIVYSGEAEMVVVRGVEGELGIMAGHIPIVTPLEIGEMRVKHDDGQEYIAVLGGYLEFSNDKATVLADAAELAQQIDVSRAEQKKQERERELTEAKADDEALVAAEISLRKALLRIKVAQRRNG
ncbi:F0F1 ATP synthase subunit epsilon [Candidatus Aquicultor secundus]|uniref:F0F1 ATP synthase subunit epsilon n=1 Tax=Candidatus Aquicultor secundus TaxID=1973895 RepID=UPI000CB14A6D|nr:F0F1 ATP synthase subunit epsilon [Candidatus Aquicultor secundus]PIU26203.1 MAG: F0F1 ATP synthase subunit epsilon [Candidatus Aquicultor secundus]